MPGIFLVTLCTMQKRKLGNSELEAAPLAFGGNVFGWTLNERESFKLLDAFTDAGFNLIDTSDSYSRWVLGNKGGESETIIGNWLKRSGRRAQVLIATKVGSDMGLGKTCLSKKYILEEVEASLRRLQVDCIDLYQTHFDDVATPVGETLEAYAQLVRQGKVRALGASNMSPERLQEALRFSRENSLPRYETYQPEYNLYRRENFERDYAPICEKEGLSVISYFSLASGFLTGKYRSEADQGKSVRGGDIGKYLNDRGFRILAALDAVAEQYNTRPATVALAWLMARPHIAAPIASATSVAQLRELTDAARLQLDEAAMAQLTEASRN
jgi:aryl-alcohol dehydrogenase-like predicted oxidoreductase